MRTGIEGRAGSPGLVRTFGELTAEIAAPLAIRFRCLVLALSALGLRFRAPVRDQPVSQAVFGSYIGKEAAQSLSRFTAPLYFCAGELGGLSHKRRVVPLRRYLREQH